MAREELNETCSAQEQDSKANESARAYRCLEVCMRSDGCGCNGLEGIC